LAFVHQQNNPVVYVRRYLVFQYPADLAHRRPLCRVCDDDILIVELAERACEMTGHKEPGLLDTLAAAYAAGGRFKDAVKTANQVLSVVKAGSQKALASKIQNRIMLYQEGRPYRQK